MKLHTLPVLALLFLTAKSKVAQKRTNILFWWLRRSISPQHSSLRSTNTLNKMGIKHTWSNWTSNSILINLTTTCLGCAMSDPWQQLKNTSSQQLCHMQGPLSITGPIHSLIVCRTAPVKAIIWKNKVNVLFYPFVLFPCSPSDLSVWLFLLCAETFHADHCSSYCETASL